MGKGQLNTSELLEMDRKYVWHPFTPMKAWMEKKDPPIIVRGEREFLFDSKGKSYIDAVSSLWCNIHGHCVPELDAAVQRQLGCVAHSTLLGLCNQPSIELAARLIDMAPRGLAKVFYSDDGSTAVEVSLKMAYQYWANQGRTDKRRFIAFGGAYHGDTLGAVSAGGIPAFHDVYQTLRFPVDHVQAPRLPPFSELNAAVGPCADNSSAPEDWEREIADTVMRYPGQHAAIIVEPVIQGAGGMIMHPAGTLTKLRRLANRHGMLLICDEVMTGFGRTGRMFACDHEGVCPDLLCLSKGLTAGYMPLGATLTTQEIFDAFYADPNEGKTFYHGHTFTGHPLACAVGIASLDLFEKTDLLNHAREMADLLWDELLALRGRPHVGDIRQTGLVSAVEIVRCAQSMQRFPWQWRVGGALCTAMREHGVLLRPLGDVLVIMPPPAIRAENIKKIARVVIECIDGELSRIVAQQEAMT